MSPTSRRALLVGVAVIVVAFFVYWFSNRDFDAGRGDFFYLADAFDHGHTWITRALGPNDVINIDGRIYVPFAPFPAFVLAPLVAITGPVTADQWESGINALLAACVVGLAWWVAGRIGARRLADRLALVLLLGFSTQVWWVTTRGGVWHTGHLVAMILTLLLLAELFGRQRALILGLLVGAAFLTRAPVAFAAPTIALWLIPAVLDRPASRSPRWALACARCRGSNGPGSPSAWRPPCCSSCGTTPTASAHRSSPGTRWPPCPRGWRSSDSRGCSPSPTCR